MSNNLLRLKILKYISKKWGIRVWARFMWLRTGMAGSCAHGNKISSSIKDREILIGEQLIVPELHGKNCISSECTFFDIKSRRKTVHPDTALESQGAE
jgi:hypothetical protein